MINVKSYQIEKVERMLTSIPNGAKKVLSRALNKAIAGARTDAVEQITKIYTIKATTVRDSLTIKKANSNNLHASLKADGSVIPLTKFKIIEGKITQNGKSRPIIRTTIKHGETKTLKHGFLATMATGHKGVFLRAGKERLPIKQVFSLSIPQMLGNKDIKNYLEDNAHERLDKAINHEIDWLLKGSSI